MFNIPASWNWKKAAALAALVLMPLSMWAYLAALSSAPNPPNPPIGYLGQDEVTNFDLTSNTETLFRPEYREQQWAGDLHAYPINSAGQIDTSTERWTSSAAVLLKAQTTRNIGTMDDLGHGVAFDSNLNILGGSSTLTINSTSYTNGQIVSYLRGDASNEGGTGLRVRAGPLGDIIHARPFYLDDDLDDTVFVGANDGMLHAFNAVDGSERWAYIPSMLLTKLPKLAYNDSSKPFSHQYFVDGQVNVGIINPTSTTTRTILVGGLGAGERGLYALDVSSLTATSDSDVASKALWEITYNSTKSKYGSTTGSSACPHLGYTYGTPLIVKMKVNNIVKDVVIVGNGYLPSSSGKAYICIIDANTGGVAFGSSAEVEVGPYPSNATSDANGIFNPKAVDTDNDGYADLIYGADLNGNLWKFTVNASGSWNTTRVFTTTNYQPVTSTLGISLHPSGGYMINFATGSTLSGAYGTYSHTSNTWTTNGTGELVTPASSTPNYVYGIWDGTLGLPVLDTHLQSQTLEERSYTNTIVTPNVTTRVRRATNNALNWATNRGWKVALPLGERVVGEGSFVENGRFYFNSYNPTVVPTLVSGTDTDIMGENWLMELNYLTGGSSSTPFLDLDGSLTLNDLDRIRYTSSDTKPAGKVTGDPITSPNEQGIAVGKFISTGVQSQPLLVRLDKLNTTLINQNPDVIFPTSSTVDRGVAGGHFDVDYFYSPTGVCKPLSGGSGSYATGSIKFSYSSKTSTAANVTSLTITAPNGEVLYTGAPGNIAPKNLDDKLVGASPSYVLTANGGGNTSTLQITASKTGTQYNGNITVVMKVNNSVSTGYTITNLSGGTNGGSTSASSSTLCSYVVHDHEYDDKYDKTGVNFLNASNANFNLSKAIPSTTTPFKVLVMNQYLNPALQLHLGKPTYVATSPAGYQLLKDFQTSNGLTIASLPTYTRANIGSFAINMPVDAFSVKNWWGASPGDYRVGLIPTGPSCVFYGKTATISSGSNTGSVNADMYNPVIPDSGSGTLGTSTGVRHNGAITVQIIRDDTPEDALELNLANAPEYGYRLKTAYFYTYVLAEYSLYWHHPSRVCYGDSSTRWYNGSQYGNSFPTASSGAWNTSTLMNGTGWTKAANPDTKASTANSTPAPNSTDPKLGVLGSSGGNAASVSTSTSGNVTTTTIRYTDGSYTLIITTVTKDKTTISTTDYTSSGAATGATNTVTVANSSGSTTTGGDERGRSPITGRISWRELLRP